MSSIAALRIQQLQTRISRFDDQLAYKELYISLYPSLYHFIIDMIKSRQITEEIISDVFIKIWEKRKSLEEILNLRVYCFVAAKNLTLNQLEKEKRQATCNIEECVSLMNSRSEDPEQLMITEEMRQRIRQVVDTLPARCKMTFKLVKENGFRYREAAEILQISEKTVENQLAIALKKINAVIHFDIYRTIPLGAGNPL
jgi:RNA polymerase sigma-70 factor (ECF subfamily)